MKNLNKQERKRLYNLTYKVRKKGFPVNTRKKQIEIYWEQVTDIAINPLALEMIKRFGYKLVQNRQMKLNF